MNKLKCFLFFSLAFVCAFSDESFDWMDRKVDEEFRLFKEGIDFSTIEQTFARRAEFYAQPKMVIIKNNKVYTNGTIQKSLDQLLKNYKLPDMIFFFFNTVGPINQMKLFDGFAPPILAGSKTEEMDNVILVFHRFCFNRQDRYGLRESLAEVAKNDIPWEKKTEKVFWRGVFTDSLVSKRFLSYVDLKNYFHDDFCSSRFRLGQLASSYPDLIDAMFFDRKDWGVSITNLLPKHGINALVPFCSIKDQLKYKYQICIDGISTTQPGFAWRLASNSCTFKVYSPNLEWFYTEVKPMVHYIPVESDLSDLVEKIRWAKDHDAEAHQIARNAKAFGQKYLTAHAYMLYTYKVLSKYASLQSLSEDDFVKAFAMLEQEGD